MSKKVFALVDCNNFFVSCERAFQPRLEKKPVLVLSSNDGCIISRSAEVKELGVQMGEPYFQCREAVRKNNITVFSSNFPLYGDLSDRVMQTLELLAPNVEVYSIDEAFIDMSDVPNPVALGKKIRETVRQWTRIPVSVGIAPTKVLAKVANHLAKKKTEYQGVCELKGESIVRALSAFPVEEIWGIGRASASLLRTNRITTALELLNQSDSWIKKHLSIRGVHIAYELRGESCFSIDTVPAPKKGMVCSRSFGKKVTSLAGLEEAVASYTSRLGEKLRQEKEVASCLYVYIRTARGDFKHKYGRTLGRELLARTSSTPVLIKTALELLREIYKPNVPYAKAGVGVTNLYPEAISQGSLFGEVVPPRHRSLMKTVDAINKKFGSETVKFAAEGIRHDWQVKKEFISKSFTTSFDDLPVAR